MLADRGVTRVARLGVLFLGVTLVHLPALLGGHYFLDVYLTEVHPHHVEIGRALADGRLPFWSSGLMLGYPLAANPQVGVFYLPHLLGLLVLSADRLLVVSAWLHCLLAGGATWGLARRAGASHVGATVSGLVYSCSPFVVFYHQAIHGLIALSLLPAILLVLWIATERRSLRLYACASLLMAMQMYAGHLQFVAYTWLGSLLFALFAVAHADARARVRAAGATVLSGAVAVLVYAPQLLAAFGLWRQSLRHDMGPSDIAANMAVEALGLDDLVELVLPRFYGGPSFRDFWYPEYLGAGVLLTVLVAVLDVRTRPARLLRGLLVGAVAYLVLVQLPGVGRVLVSLPGLSAFRAPGRVFCLVLLAAAVLSGLGVDALVRDGLRRAALAAAALLAAAGLLVAVGATAGVGPRDPEFDAGLLDGLRLWDGLAVAGVAAALAGLSAARRVHRLRNIIPILAGVVVAAPTLLVGARYLPVVDAAPASPLVGPLRGASAGRVRRILGVSAGDGSYMAAVPGPLGWPYMATSDPTRAGWSLPSSVGMAHGLRNLHGQTSLPLRRFVHRFFGADVTPLDYPFQRHPFYDSALLAHAGVTHISVAAQGQMPIRPRPVVLLERDNVQLLEIPNPRPAARFYPYSMVRGVAGEAEAMAAVRREGALPDVPLIVEGMDGPPPAAPAGATPFPAEVLEESDGFARIRITAPAAGVLLYTESWYPGWLALVDGQPRDVVPADGALIGVALTAGEHEVELRFVPLEFASGLPAAALGLLLILLGVFYRRRVQL